MSDETRLEVQPITWFIAPDRPVEGATVFVRPEAPDREPDDEEA